MGESSQSIPATFPLNVRNGKRRFVAGNEEDDDPIEEETDPVKILKSLRNQMINLTTIVNELNNKMDNHISTCKNDAVKDLQSQVLSTQEALLNINKNQYEDDKKRKFRCIPRWGELHKARRDSYYKFYAVTTEADLMEQYVTSDPPYIMRAYRPKYSPGEKPERYKLRENHAKSAMMVDVNQKRITAREMLEKYTDIDKEVSDICDALEEEEDKLYLKELWIKEVTKAEEKSETWFNQKRKPWWLNLSTKYPYTGQKTGEELTEGANIDVQRNNTRSSDVEMADTEVSENATFTTVTRQNSRSHASPSIPQRPGTDSRNDQRSLRANSRNKQVTVRENVHKDRGDSQRGRGHSRGRGASRNRGRSKSRGVSRGRGVYNPTNRSNGRGRATSRGRGSSRSRGTNHTRGRGSRPNAQQVFP